MLGSTSAILSSDQGIAGEAARRVASNRHCAGTIQMRAGLSFIVGRTEANLMGSNIVYIVGAVVIVLAILSFFGLR
jgi:hypothetical protein